MKKIALITTASALFVFGFIGISMADHHYHGCPGMMMGDLSGIDTDNDDLIDIEKFVEPHMEKYRGWFEMLDNDENGFLGREEWDEFRSVHGFGDNSEG